MELSQAVVACRHAVAVGVGQLRRGQKSVVVLRCDHVAHRVGHLRDEQCIGVVLDRGLISERVDRRHRSVEAGGVEDLPRAASPPQPLLEQVAPLVLQQRGVDVGTEYRAALRLGHRRRPRLVGQSLYPRLPQRSWPAHVVEVVDALLSRQQPQDLLAGQDLGLEGHHHRRIDQSSHRRPRPWLERVAVVPG